MKRILSLVLVGVMLLVCASALADKQYQDGTVLRMATGYNSAKTGISFDAETAGNGVTLADGITYNTGSLKPTWVEAEKVLGVALTVFSILLRPLVLSDESCGRRLPSWLPQRTPRSASHWTVFPFKGVS